ncbi:MAG: ATP-binding cassette domain-containing protein [Acidobacteria bacterium]|nr:ATP-binding cassette domain-containing protein [Acidobacteriota bacterium]
MIKVEGLTKRYGRTIAVNNISFEVEKGQIVGFLGPNGAGKTTTMRVLTCFLPPTEGRASVAGFDVMKQPLEVKRRIGYLPESPPLYPEMEVYEYLTFVGRIKGVAKSDIRRRVSEVTERCALGDVSTKLISKLSRGYRQRVGLAQALIHNPDVLILDEPTAGLDPKQIIETRKLIHQLSGEHTIILSTHILPEVSTTCQMVIIINQGKLEAIDTPENLTARLQGHETIFLEVDGPADQVGAKLQGMNGVNRVTRKDGQAGRTSWEVEAVKDHHIRGDLARLVVSSGWGLHELRPVGLSLEEIFLKLTTADKAEATAAEQKVSGGAA